jgi:hypothetical protein
MKPLTTFVELLYSFLYSATIINAGSIRARYDNCADYNMKVMHDDSGKIQRKDFLIMCRDRWSYLLGVPSNKNK